MEGTEGVNMFNIVKSNLLDTVSTSFSEHEVREAIHTAFLYMPTLTGRSSLEDDLPAAIRILNVLTSDEAWSGNGSGKGVYRVKSCFKLKVRTFLRDLLHLIEQDSSLRYTPGVVDFMVVYFGHVHSVFFVKILRAYILAFQDTGDSRYIDLGDEDSKEYTALLFAASDNRIPFPVLKTLLEGGADVDLPNQDGDTAIMLAIENHGDVACSKVESLLAYGADIGVYNLCMQNVIHLAVYTMNIPGLRLVLQMRDMWRECDSERQPAKKNLGTTKKNLGTTKKKLIRKTARLDPDPLHLPDHLYHTPLSLVTLCPWANYKTRIEVVEMLVSAGSEADLDLDYEERLRTARVNRGQSAAPRCFGIISTHLLGDRYTIFAIVRKDGYSVKLRMDSDVFQQFIDTEQSVLPPPSMSQFSIDNLLICFESQRFDFEVVVDGIDMDIYFNVTGTTGQYTEVVGCDNGAEFKLALRFPRGPCPLDFWIQDVRGFQAKIVHDKKYTLAHRAVKCKCPKYRRDMFYMTRNLCNPLIQCAGGLTAGETLALQLKGGVFDWDTSRILKVLCKDREDILAHIHPDTSLFTAGCPGTVEEQVTAVATRLQRRQKIDDKKSKKKPNQYSRNKRPGTNPFTWLPDDICERIVRLVVMDQ